ncbi:MAG: hypothetical protein E7368_05365 [Clostridiales bacterium]|nr:hypothetical protein [Clostridiales bacterium]
MRNYKTVTYRVVNKKSGIVVDMFGKRSRKYAKEVGLSLAKGTKVSDLEIYHNIPNPFYKKR